MPQVHRMGDRNSAGGAVTDIPQSTVYVNGRLASVDGSEGTTHPPGEPPHTHGAWVTANGLATVRIEGRPVNARGDADTCGHQRAAGSKNVYVGG